MYSQHLKIVKKLYTTVGQMYINHWTLQVYIHCTCIIIIVQVMYTTDNLTLTEFEKMQ